MGYAISPEAIQKAAGDIGEKTIVSRTGGAPTLAIGMVHIFHQVLGGEAAMAFWYHFAILFEALFILTTVDAGTRILRFMLQEMLSHIHPSLGDTRSWTGNIIGTALAVAAWGYFIYQGVIDPLGGINTLWPLFGLSNQILSVIALIFITVMLLKMGKKKYIAVTLIPLVCMVIVTFITSIEKIFSSNPAVGFFAHAIKFSTAQKAGNIVAPAKNASEMSQIITNDVIDGTLCCIFLMIAIVILFGAIRFWFRMSRGKEVIPLRESPYIEVGSLTNN
jgi:carbon starvation protein